MHLNSPILFIEINKSEFVFVVINKSENDNYKILYSGSIPLSGIIETKIMDLESIHNLLNSMRAQVAPRAQGATHGAQRPRSHDAHRGRHGSSGVSGRALPSLPARA